MCVICYAFVRVAISNSSVHMFVVPSLYAQCIKRPQVPSPYWWHINLSRYIIRGNTIMTRIISFGVACNVIGLKHDPSVRNTPNLLIIYYSTSFILKKKETEQKICILGRIGLSHFWACSCKKSENLLLPFFCNTWKIEQGFKN